MTDIITYQELREIHSKENNTNSLQPLEEDFFKKVNMYLKQKHQMLSKTDTKKDNLFSQTSKRKIEKEILNIQRVFKNLIQLRERKIAARALIDVRLGVESDKGMTKLEIKLYRDLLGIFRKFEEEFESNHKADTTKIIIEKEIQKFNWGGRLHGPFEENEEVELPTKLAETLINGKKAKIVSDE